LYLLDIDNRRCALLNDQDRRTELAAASLDQRWVANAALQFIFFADLELVEKEYGPRSYRFLNIAAGRFGQRLYLGAAALNLGCCAVGAFYDRELIKACLLPDNFDPLYLVAVGPVVGK
ncbi:MAG: nitroreductase family protein, partial [Deltaproteobacteria bacterium]|nr:nitroreductase family protein [Deltaproteobacteria bacterium]